MGVNVTAELRAPSASTNVTALTALTAGHVMVDGGIGLLSPLLPDLQARFSLTRTALALLVALLAASSSVSQPVLGVVADRVGARRAAALGVVTAAALLTVAVSTSLVVVFVTIVVGGLGAAAFHPAAVTLVRGVSGSRPDAAVGVFSAGGMLGLAAGPVIIVALLGAGHRNLIPLLAVPIVATGWWVHRSPHAIVRPRSRPRHRPSDQPSALAPALPMRAAWATVLRGPVAGLALAATLSHVAWTTYISVTPQIIAAATSSTAAPEIGWTLAAFNLAAAAGGIVAGMAVVRAGRVVVVTASLAVALPALLASVVVAPGTSWSLLAAAVAGAGVHASLPLLAVAAQDLVPDQPSAAAGMIFGLAVGGGGVLYLPIAWLQQQIGITPAAVVAYLLVVPAAVLAAVILRRHGGPNDRTPPPLMCPCGCSCLLDACPTT